MIKGITFDKQLMRSKDHAHEINHYFQGKVGVTRGCNVSENVDGNLVVSSGYFIIGGRLVSVESPEIITIPSVPSGLLYSILVFEIDLTKTNSLTEFNQGVFKILSDAADYPVLIQQDLENDGTMYQFEFVRFENSSSGIASLVDTRTLLDMALYAKKSVEVSKTLTASSWVGASVPYTYALSVTGVTTTSNQEVLPSTACTLTELEALQAANIQDAGQAADTINLKAWGDKPSIDIPIRVILRGDA